MAKTVVPIELSSTPGIVDNSNATAITIDSSEDVTLAGHIVLADSKIVKLGTGADLQLYHDGSHSYINNSTGNLAFDVAGDFSIDADGGDIVFNDGGSEIGRFTNSSSDFVIKTATQDKDLIFKGNDGGSVITALTLDYSDAGTASFNHDIKLGDSSEAIFGASTDLRIAHDSTDSFMTNNTGDLYFNQLADDKDILFRSDDGAGGITTYFRLDGSAATHDGSNTTATYTKFPDNSYLTLGTGDDLQIYHDGSYSYIKDAGTGDLRIQASTNVQIYNSALDKQSANFHTAGPVTLYYDNSAKFATSSSGVTVTGTLTASGITVDELTIDADTITATDDFIIDATTNIFLDADGGEIVLRDGGSNFGYFHQDSDNFEILSTRSDGDIIIKGNDGGSTIAALTLDMSDAGTAIFNNTIKVSADSDVVAEIGRAHVGGGLSGLSDYAVFSHLHSADSGGYALAQNASGATFLNADDGQDIKFLAHGTTKMTMSSDGNVGIAETSPDRPLHICGPDGTTGLIEGNSRTALFLDNAGATYINLASANNANAGLFFSDADANNRGGVIYEHTNDALTFDTAATERMRIKDDGKVGIGTDSPSNMLDIMGGGYDQIRIGSNKTDNNNKTAGIVSTMYTNNSVSLFQLFAQNGNSSLYYGSADGAHRGLQNHYFYTNAGYNATTSHTKMMEINYLGQIKSGSGGMVLQTKEAYGSTATSISSGSSAVICSTTITVKENSKLAVWGHSGQIQSSSTGQNANMLIQWENSGGTTTNISDHNGNHYGWDQTDNVERQFMTSQGISGALSAGTYTVRLLGGAYNGPVTMNYQGQGSHMIIQEISAD